MQILKKYLEWFNKIILTYLPFCYNINNLLF